MLNFASLIYRYASNPCNAAISEHVHIGPYLYLTIGTWTHPDITREWIVGSLQDLLALSTTMELSLLKALPGDIIRLRGLFAPEAPYDIILHIKEDAFDPALYDTVK